MFKLKSIKTQLIIYLACLAIFLSVKDKDIAFLFLTIIAVVSALVIESIILYFRTRTLQITESSIITGLIIGYVLSSDELWLKFVFVSLLAIISKYLIRFQNKHIFPYKNRRLHSCRASLSKTPHHLSTGDECVAVAVGLRKNYW